MPTTAALPRAGTASIRVVIADDHQLVNDGLSAMIHRIHGYEVLFTALNGRQLIEKAREQPAFGIAVVDLRMPVMNGYETIAWFVRNMPRVRCIALSTWINAEWVQRALKAGASGFLPKNMDDDEMRLALVEVQCGREYVSPLVSDDLTTDTPAEPPHVTPREREFLQLLCDKQDYTYERIAELMQVQLSTVEGYARSLGLRYNLHSRGALVRFAFQQHIVSTYEVV